MLIQGSLVWVQEQESAQLKWAEADRKKRLLAARIDCLFFGVSWVLAAWRLEYPRGEMTYET
jgi:hypothetical protein